ncbi:hypothetical protein NLG97_g10241 [Lecanicillium saksenae]|uniref:Uncharacterized protein n=1 Tax=Lecanicillium saksenae TaxID=468837 RepID=A0ACC1QHP5_9HYPO|nr:hypothetical protein NLG97_g10241 [Lecanicillium saksenae]
MDTTYSGKALHLPAEAATGGSISNFNNKQSVFQDEIRCDDANTFSHAALQAGNVDEAPATWTYKCAGKCGRSTAACVKELQSQVAELRATADDVAAKHALCTGTVALPQQRQRDARAVAVAAQPAQAVTGARRCATDKTGPGPVESFKQPARRCKLRRILSAEADRILVDVGRLTTNEPGAVLNTYETDGTVRPLPIHEYDSCYTDLEIVAATFIEYQPDGSWREACTDRLYASDDQESVQASPYIPIEQRPGPEEVRLNDLDAEFKVVRPPLGGWRPWLETAL